jgi:hypothetical protein
MTYVASVDAGNGGVNAVLAQKRRYKSVGFPSIRAAATGDSLGLGKELELDYTWYDWNGFRYIVGDDAIKISRRRIERHLGPDRYANEFHQFLVAVALTQLGVKSGEVDLTLFAPPGMYNQLKTDMVYRFNQRQGAVSLTVKGEGKARSWNYNQITVWPEGIGAAACFILDDQGEMVNSDMLAGEVLIVDAGAYTLDVLQMADGNFNPESLQHATWPDQGLQAHVLYPILQTLKQSNDEFLTLTIDDVDRVLRLGLASEDYTLRWAGLEVDVKALIDKHSERYAEWVANNVIDAVFAGLRGIKAAILVGGGATLITEHLGKWYGDKLLDARRQPATRKIHPTDFNAVGGLRFALMRQKQTA